MNSSVLVISALVVLLARSSLQEAQPEGAREARGYQGGGGRGQGGFGGGQGGNSRYGFNIVDAQDRYGYEANYPGGRASFFLLGPNRAPGAQRGGSQGSQGGYQQGGSNRGGW
ncbi:H/ACA ribonucleoprotein complex subunit GAR1-like [Homalodisca vitripennis]|uniref:H/ACA ribonucleoprotein complex subunit GAR1-like n=1 Tax=Homalodisca vitripennis TaxID=197043 RepID=UPI001EEBF21C|nr:H/ACA ribonucleoprotein complex subunit GAR1-like [Homalodisca vitripennis]KAG8277071.1 hypothetical protein J6590_049980 [Homalodisca vitripennis]